jgi:tetratricopeptide (TPR) repeat protein
VTGRLRIGLAGAVAAIVATASLLGGVLRDSAPAGAAQGVAGPAAGELLAAGLGAGDTAELVRGLERALRARPDDVRANVLLGLAYQQRARETGDAAYYPRSEAVLRRALALAPDDVTAVTGLGSLALARHRFRDALALGRRAVRLSPEAARPHGVVGDALVELGRYDEAFAAFDTMARLKPGVASYARVAYARELIGRPRDAIAAMRLAVDAATGQPEAQAWSLVELGKLHFAIGERRRAARAYRAALTVFPGYVYALEPLARVEAAEGRHVRAISLARQAAEALPLPQFLTTLGDLYRADGRPALARRQYALVDAVERLLRANGVRTDLEAAVLRADRGVRPDETVALAREARRARPSIGGDSALAWALARAGRCGEALRFSERALRLGTRDALEFFHRGMIERCLGDRREARAWFRRALATNPDFSLRWAPLARRYAS